MLDNDIKVGEYGYTKPNITSCVKGLCNYGKPNPVVDPQCWDFANSCVFLEFYPFLCGSKIVSRDFAMSQMNKQTSVGGLWGKVFKNKGEFFTHPLCDAILDSYNSSLDDVDEMIHVLRKFFPKMEVRKIEKLLQDPPGIREAAADDIVAVVLSNEFSLDWNNKFYSSNGKHASAVGGTKYYGGFHRLAVKFAAFPLRFSFDFSNFDASMFFQLMAAQMKFRWDCYDPSVKTQKNWIRYCNFYLSEILSFLWSEDGNIYLKFFGVISGSGNTLPNNTMNCYRLWCLVFAMLWFEEHLPFVQNVQKEMDRYSKVRYGTEEQIALSVNIDVMKKGFISFEYMNSVFKQLVTGDDNSPGVKESILGWFNFPKIQLAFQSLGIGVTSDFDVPKSIFDITFVSQRWVQIPGYTMYFPAPDRKRVWGTLCYGSRHSDVRFQLLRVFALRIESWADLELRSLIEQLIIKFRREHSELLVGEFKVGDMVLTMEQINTCYLTDTQILSLYCGFEDAVHVSGLFQNVFKIFYVSHLSDHFINLRLKHY